MIILAAGTGRRLRPLTDMRPKCMVELGGRSLLQWQIHTARSLGIKDISVVAGYRSEMVIEDEIKKYVNEDFENSNMVASLWCARDEFVDEFIVSYADILYEVEVLESLVKSEHDISVVVDAGWRHYWDQRFSDPLTDAESLSIKDSGEISSIGQKVNDISQIEGQYIGLIKFRGDGVRTLIEMIESLQKGETDHGRESLGPGSFKSMYMTDLLQKIIDNGYSIAPVYTNRKWLEVDSIEDYELAGMMIEGSSGELMIRDRY